MINFKDLTIEVKDKEKFLIKKNDLYFSLVARRTALLLRACLPAGYVSEKRYKEIFGYFANHKPLYSGDRGIFLGRKTMNNEKEIVSKKIKENDDYLLDIADKCQQEGAYAIEYGKSLHGIIYKNKTDEELKELVSKGLSILYNFSVYLLFPISIQGYLEENVKDKLKDKLGTDKVEEYFSSLATPIKGNTGFYEQKGILEIAIRYKKENNLTEDIKVMIDKYLLDFAAMGTKYGIGKLWIEKEVIERIKNISLEEPDGKLKHLLDIEKQNESKVKEVIDFFDNDEELIKYIKWMRTYIYIRTYRTDILTIVLADMFPLLIEIGKRYDLSFEDVLNCLPHEVNNFEFPDKKLINERIKNILILGEKSKIYYTYGNLADNVTSDINKIIGYKEKKNEKIETKELAGSSANKGYVRGRVKIILDNTELGKVKKGDIIVASMTTPDFVPAMEKAAAFITDEGGILCHAAIVSREMNKPCVIGTKIATQVLEDGMEVEVDAGKGIVKIIKN